MIRAMATNPIVTGKARGRIIELDDVLALPEGQAVTVIVRPIAKAEGVLRRAFGSWSDTADELEQFLRQTRSDRNDAPSQRS